MRFILNTVGMAALSLLLACGGGGGGGGSTSALDPTVDAQVHAVAVAGYQAMGAGAAFALGPLTWVAPTGSPLRSQSLGAGARVNAQPMALRSPSAQATPTLTYLGSLNLYATGLVLDALERP